MIRLKNAGSAPIPKNPLIKINANERFAKVINYVKTKLVSGNTFLYINGAFSPSPFAMIKDLYACFRVQNELIVNFALTEAWG